VWRPGNLDRPTGVFIALIVVALTLVSLDLSGSGQGFGGTLREGAQNVFTPVQRVVASATRPVADFFEGLSDIFSLREENRALRSRIAELEQELQETAALQVRVEELEKILDVSPPEDLDTITARVLAVGVSEFDHIRVIDKGRSDGITVDMPVVDEGGLVGRVVAVTDDVARIRLITDPTMRVAVRVERTGETGVLTGRGTGAMQLEIFNTDAAVVEGDLLVTADGRFPAGIPVAVIAEAARSEVGFALRTTAQATAAVTRVDFVKILVFTRDQAGVADLEDLEQTPIEVPSDPAEPSEGETEQPAPTTSTTEPTGTTGGSAEP
jgi:rod shape-determining protein MreC